MAKIGELKPNYKFVDFSILRKTSDGRYVDVTDFSFSDIEDTVIQTFNTNAPYILCMYVFAVQEQYFCEVTVPELCNLAGIKPDGEFVKHLRNSIDEVVADEILAQLCANKIVNYLYGKAVKKENSTEYEFFRQSYNNSAATARNCPCVLRKTFIKNTAREMTLERGRA